MINQGLLLDITINHIFSHPDKFLIIQSCIYYFDHSAFHAFGFKKNIHAIVVSICNPPPKD